jgi:hypothetical protein
MDNVAVSRLVLRLEQILEEHNYNHGSSALITAVRRVVSGAQEVLKGHPRSDEVIGRLSRGSASSALEILREIHSEIAVE